MIWLLVPLVIKTLHGFESFSNSVLKVTGVRIFICVYRSFVLFFSQSVHTSVSCFIYPTSLIFFNYFLIPISLDSSPLNWSQFKNKINNNIEIDSQTQKTNLWLPKGKGRGINQELGINRYTLLYIKYINKDLLYSTGNYIQYPVINHNGKNMKKNMCTYMHN